MSLTSKFEGRTDTLATGAAVLAADTLTTVLNATATAGAGRSGPRRSGPAAGRSGAAGAVEVEHRKFGRTGWPRCCGAAVLVSGHCWLELVELVLDLVDLVLGLVVLVAGTGTGSWSLAGAGRSGHGRHGVTLQVDQRQRRLRTGTGTDAGIGTTGSWSLALTLN